MKKLLLINTKYKILGGEDANIIEEYKFLEKNFDVQFLEFDNSKRLSFFDILAFFLNSNIQSNKEVSKTIKNFNPEVIYIHNTWFKLNLGIFKLLRKHREIQVIIKIHNLRYDCSRHFIKKAHLKGKAFCNACSMEDSSTFFFNKYYKDSWVKSLLLWRYSKKYINILRKFPLKILVLNDFHKKHLSNLNVDNNKILNYYNPIFYNKNTYNPDSDYVVYAGRLNREKGLTDLLKAWRSSEIEDMKLIIIGTGELFGPLKAEYSSDNIIFLGELNNNETKDYIRNSRAVITATKMYEGQPRLLCEASSYGVPSIYPSFGGMDEYFPEEYKYSFTQFDYEDLVTKIHDLRNKNQLIKESMRVFEHIGTQFSMENASKVFNEILCK